MDTLNNGFPKYDDPADILITRKHTDELLKQKGLRRVLTSVDLWGIGVGTVISGQYFGWNYGLSLAGPAGFLITVIIVTLAYILFITIFSKLSIILPYAGGPYAYTRKGLGSLGGFIAGVSAVMEFLFAASAITLSIGSYLNFILPETPAALVATLSFIIFIVIDITGIKRSAIFQLTVTCLSLSGIVLFIMGGMGSVDISGPILQPILPSGIKGVLAAVPFAIWFYICLEGLAMAAEETKNPSRNLPLGFLTSMITLVIVSFSVLIIAVGTVHANELTNIDYPLSYIIEKVQKGDNVLLIVFTTLTLFALFASLNGNINSYSRQTFALSRAGYFPMFLSKLLKRTKTPYLSIVLPGIAGVFFTFTLSIEFMVALSAFSGLVMYVFVTISYIKITYNENNTKKDGKFIILAYAALGLAVLFLFTYAVADLKRIGIFTGIYIIIALYYYFIARKNIIDDAPEEIESKYDKLKGIIKD